MAKKISDQVLILIQNQQNLQKKLFSKLLKPSKVVAKREIMTFSKIIK